ncbi:hypothetical protein [Candidatus Nitrotoga sp. M5]|uniref:hypothetical protein n=1 Tax=Candidatus Nitrotoga sp. M5 TaxID=2890409 RepID=UPI001EF39922|nr:hypothetical protein [Candidatus Nitrotoga sp. M5]CAH1386371.1 hypothetical protein NTGM5_270004 [Candidatus Nitrotoga sp. M5]
MNLTIVGLIFDIVGTWCIAYEILRGYPKRNRANLLRGHQKQRLEFAKHMKNTYLNLPSDVYSEEEKRKMSDGVTKKYYDNANKLEREIENELEPHMHLSFFWGVIGVICLTIGFLLQIEAASGSIGT